VTQTDPTQRRVKTEGVAPAAVGLKVHFIDADGSQRPSVGAIVRFFPRSSSSNFRTTRATGDFRLAADWDFLPEWSLNPNVGVGVYEGEARRLYTAGLFAATLSYNPSKSLKFFVDTGVQTPETGTAAPLSSSMSGWPGSSAATCSPTSEQGQGWQARHPHGRLWRRASASASECCTACVGAGRRDIFIGRLPSALKAQRASCAP